ncbi:hypothetical protein LTR49_028767 [Elasticomyces elasticus]|nr:hypothetical protein LTR49_028767 [Elasticomyces elasticus]
MVDDLLHDLNKGKAGLPKGMFYADDGALLYTDDADIPMLLLAVDRWCTRNGIELNVGKCGHISSTYTGPQVMWRGHPLPRVAGYRYLGFPVTAAGIDFEAHIENRLKQAVAKVGFMARHSASWGVAIRLRAYRQYVAPILEYGAPLVFAWGTTQSMRWMAANMGWRELVQWIANGVRGWRMSQNLLGLQPLEDRFEVLHMTFMFDLQHAPSDNPLFQMLFRPSPSKAFKQSLRDSKLLTSWKRSILTGPVDKAAMRRFQHRHLVLRLDAQAKRTHLTAIIPWASRLRKGGAPSDGVLRAPRHMQNAFFQYRRGVWCFRFIHKCEFVVRPFQRGDDECPCQSRATSLSLRERRRKSQQRIALGVVGRFTNVDFLLNEGQWARAYEMLQRVRANLTAVWVEEMAEPDMDEDDLMVTL